MLPRFNAIDYDYVLHDGGVFQKTPLTLMSSELRAHGKLTPRSPSCPLFVRFGGFIFAGRDDDVWFVDYGDTLLFSRYSVEDVHNS